MQNPLCFWKQSSTALPIMLWISVLLTLLTYWTGSFAQYVLTQPPSVSVSLEQNVQITCLGDGIGSKYAHWYQQKPGMAPLLIIYKDNERPTEISDRFSGSNSGNTATLSISRAKAEDEADYYCQVWDSNTAVFGGGTQLTVTGGPPSPPTVNLYCPSKEEMASKGTGTLVCSITGFYPSAMLTTWEADGTPISNGVQTTKPIKDNGEYMASSYLPVTAREWQSNKDYSCKVRHEGQDYKKSVSQSQCP